MAELPTPSDDEQYRPTITIKVKTTTESHDITVQPDATIREVNVECLNNFTHL